MSTVYKQTRDGKVSWQARWRDPAGQQRKKSFKRRVDADSFLTTVENAILTGAYISPAAGRVTVGEFAGTWLTSQVHLKPSTLDGYRSLVRTHVLPAWGAVRLSGVTHSGVSEWVGALVKKGLSPARVRHAHRVLALILAAAVRDQRIVRNPAEKVNLPRVVQRDKRFLTHEEVERVAEGAGAYRLAVYVLAYCGLRFGELAALRVRRVDVGKRRLEVAESVTEVEGGMAWTDPKRYKRRSVPVPRFLADDLAVHLAGRAGDELVFTAPGGGVLRNTNWRRDCFDQAASDAGLEGLTPHELRHTAASLAIAEGANAKDVQRMLGHASAAMTWDVYTHLFEDNLDDVADRLDIARKRKAS